jgi:hypothetical protein
MGAFASCTGGSSAREIFINVVNPSTQDDAEIFIVAEIDSKVLNQSQPILWHYSQYQDCRELVSIGLSNPSPANTEAAWDAAVPNIRFQSDLYDFGEAIVSAFERLVTFTLSHSGRMLDVLLDHQVAVKALMDLFSTILIFDEITVQLPRLLGDLSFFRRTAARREDFNEYEALYQKSSEISMFFAQSSPLLSKATTAVQNMARNPQDVPRILELFAAIVAIFTSIQRKQPFDDPVANALCHRTIVGALLVYDAVSSAGAFRAKSCVQALQAVQVLASATPKQSGLLNLLKYGSKHYNDPTTRKEITAVVN